MGALSDRKIEESFTPFKLSILDVTEESGSTSLPFSKETSHLKIFLPHDGACLNLLAPE